LEAREREFGIEKDISPGARIVTTSLQGIARAIVESGQSSLKWTEATRVVHESTAEASMLGVVQWLVGANLLIEEAPDASDGFSAGGTLRLAFERLGDFLVASELLTRFNEEPLELDLDSGGRWQSLLQRPEENYGILSALSILIPEHEAGRELPELMASSYTFRDVLVEITLSSIPWRDPDSFSFVTRDLVMEALRRGGLSQIAMDSMLAVAWRPSAIDATWLHDLLEAVPLARRDAFWCDYLYQSYEESGPVRRLIDSAIDLPLEDLELDVAERWAILLLWFTAAADRRIKDRATRALVKIFIARGTVVAEILERFLDLDDDEVRERLLLASYGALIISRDKDVAGRLASILHEAFRSRPQDFDNAIIRDHIRCISELTYKLDSSPAGCDPLFTMERSVSDWPLNLPADENQIERWGGLLALKPTDLSSDFARYSLECLRSWKHAVTKEDMVKWILQRVARDFGYEGSGCENYDGYILSKYGGGRSKPAWAERIGKKYKWLAAYQLASRLYDHVDPMRDSWEPAPLVRPLILLEERKLDPTLLSDLPEGKRAAPWWLTTAADLEPAKGLTDEEWIAREWDVPALEDLLSAVEHNGQNWRLLVCYPAWDNRSEDAAWSELYRRAQMQVCGHLVPKGDFAAAYEYLDGRNFLGRWMPEGASWLHGFAGEYPWAASFNTEPEEWLGRKGFGKDLPFACEPSWNQVTVEWEYDASLPDKFQLLVPARTFFGPSDLWWDGKDGFRLIGGRTVFRDPSNTEAGPSSLLGDVDDVIERLNTLGLRLVWTLVGEKWILGGPYDRSRLMKAFNQVACLGEDGSLLVGERVFFDDERQNTGPIVSAKGKRGGGTRRPRKGRPRNRTTKSS